MSSASEKARNLLYGSLAVAAAAAAGAYFGSNAPGRGSSEEPRDLAEVRAAIGELNASVRELSARMAERAGAPEGEVQPARRDAGSEGNDAPADALVERMERVFSRLEEALAASRRADQDANGAETGELRVPSVEAPAAVFEALKSDSDQQRAIRHFGWTPQKVLDTYGIPADIRPSPSGGGVKWYYDDAVFWFIDGRIANVFLN